MEIKLIIPDDGDPHDYALRLAEVFTKKVDYRAMMEGKEHGHVIVYNDNKAGCLTRTKTGYTLRFREDGKGP